MYLLSKAKRYDQKASQGRGQLSELRVLREKVRGKCIKYLMPNTTNAAILIKPLCIDNMRRWIARKPKV